MRASPNDRQARPAGTGPERRTPKGLVSMNHDKHPYWLLGIVAVGAVLVLTGNVGGWLFLLWPAACVAMMVWMMWGMRGMAAAPAPVPPEHTHDDGLTHAHR
ncbi:MAG: hypothetical protein Q8R60_14850 [Mycobacteriales bacterium]|nr:hypothetical protein [Mycobacteriales bacterium]